MLHNARCTLQQNLEQYVFFLQFIYGLLYNLLYNLYISIHCYTICCTQFVQCSYTHTINQTDCSDKAFCIIRILLNFRSSKGQTLFYFFVTTTKKRCFQMRSVVLLQAVLVFVCIQILEHLSRSLRLFASIFNILIYAFLDRIDNQKTHAIFDF